jgi:adenylate kinase
VDAGLRHSWIVVSQLNTVVAASLSASKPLAVLLYGAPGSGKGTLGRLLSQVTAWPHISTGELLRKHIAAGTPAGQASRGILKGGYAPDSVVNQVVMERMGEPDCRKGVILDGYPRTLNQAVQFLPVLLGYELEPVLVCLKLDYTEVKVRLQARRFCSSCGAIFNLVRLPPRDPGVCDECGGDLVCREDDQTELMDRRIDSYSNLTEPVAVFLRARSVKTLEFNGMETPMGLTAALLAHLKGLSLIHFTHPPPNDYSQKSCRTREDAP